MKESFRKIAERVYRDPTSGTIEDLKKLARAVLDFTGGKPR